VTDLPSGRPTVTSRPRAAVDSGTNSTRLLVVDGDGRVLARRTTITRLGRGVDRNGRLDDGALRRTLDTIASYREIWRGHGVHDRDVRVAATSAVRDATDDRYVDAVVARVGIRPVVLSGDDEARLSFRGALAAADDPGAPRPAAVLDIGGGSTELVVGDRHDRVVAAVSLQIGSVRLTERVLHGDPPGRGQVASARGLIEEALDVAEADLTAWGAPLATSATLIGVAGTATTMAALVHGVPAAGESALHGVVVTAGDVAAWADRLVAMTSSGRAGLEAVAAGREDVIAAGALILSAVLARHPGGVLRVSTCDGLDALVAAIP
jgi:exopolyphosphatase/guanosine-5'-triphosphate,3'-diphosphate pyrophosphatase